jgi:hypothetical protein
MYLKRNIDTRSCNHYWHGEAMSITYTSTECEFVVLGIHHATRVRHIVICGLAGSTIFFSHYLTNGTIFEKKILNLKMCFDFVYIV